MHLTKKIISGIVVLFALIIFHIPIEIFLSKTVVEFVLSHVPSIWYNNLIFLLIAGAISLFAYIKFTKYTPSINFSVVLIGTSIIYTVYRWTGSTWEFTAFAGCPKLKYADLLILVTVCQLMLFIRPKNPKHVDSKKSFIEDASIGADGKDELGYGSYAEILADRIRHSNFDKSYAIGINGKWGLGKTSFIDLVKRSLNGDDMIEVNFNPWNSHTPKAIIKDFFETFQS